MPQSPFQYSIRQGYMAIGKIFPSLGCCTDWRAESRGWEEHRSTCISKVHCWAMAFILACFYAQVHFFLSIKHGQIQEAFIRQSPTLRR